ncbi:hypothetical protein CGRA01v4_03411 [Colletotrichum graminicola]|nr:hypothetical protein CGRA01v4_03411 [Colletotrichum graminicola]
MLLVDLREAHISHVRKRRLWSARSALFECEMVQGLISSSLAVPFPLGTQNRSLIGCPRGRHHHTLCRCRHPPRIVVERVGGRSTGPPTPAWDIAFPSPPSGWLRLSRPAFPHLSGSRPWALVACRRPPCPSPYHMFLQLHIPPPSSQLWTCDQHTRPTII